MPCRPAMHGRMGKLTAGMAWTRPVCRLRHRVCLQSPVQCILQGVPAPGYLSRPGEHAGAVGLHRASLPPEPAVRLRLLTQAPIDRADLLHPAAPVAVLQLQDVAERPVEVVRNEGYLLVELIEGVACYPPAGVTSTSKFVPQLGQVAGTRLWPFSLMRR
jgi:hypothetical protein